jgi:5-methylcytosine-specific restriction endonuclease McrA
MKKRPPYNQEAAIRGALRRAFSRSPIVQEVMAASRRQVPRFNKDGSRHKKDWVQRQCQVCDEWVSTSKMAVDHKIPVISVDHGKQSWDEFIARLWCDKSNLQRICDPCHDKKTQEERITRLLIKYTAELDNIEARWPILIIEPKALLKQLSKFTAKKKTIGLESVVERAMKLKDVLKPKRS